MTVSVNKIDHLISDVNINKVRDYEILIGFKAFLELNQDFNFLTNITTLRDHPSKKFFKNIEIRITAEPNQIELNIKNSLQTE